MIHFNLDTKKEGCLPLNATLSEVWSVSKIEVIVAGVILLASVTNAVFGGWLLSLALLCCAVLVAINAVYRTYIEQLQDDVDRYASNYATAVRESNKQFMALADAKEALRDSQKETRKLAAILKVYSKGHEHSATTAD